MSDRFENLSLTQKAAVVQSEGAQVRALARDAWAALSPEQLRELMDHCSQSLGEHRDWKSNFQALFAYAMLTLLMDEQIDRDAGRAAGEEEPLKE